MMSHSIISSTDRDEAWPYHWYVGIPLTPDELLYPKEVNNTVLKFIRELESADIDNRYCGILREQDQYRETMAEVIGVSYSCTS